MKKHSLTLKGMAILEIMLCLILTVFVMTGITHVRMIRHEKMEAVEKQRVWNPEVELKASGKAYEKCKEDFDSLNRYSSDEKIERVCERLLEAERNLERDRKMALEQTADPDRISAIREDQMTDEQVAQRASELLEEVRKQRFTEISVM